MSVSQINLVVSDLERSRAFYEAVGCRLRPIMLPGNEAPGAWAATTGFAPVCLHGTEFAAWWDSSAPAAAAGSATLDVTIDARPGAVAFVETIRSHGGRVVQELADMPWGQSYAVVADPDGYRWGIRSALSTE
ncbi:VOC family protein [Occultella aeris]|uniref:Glyoxalase-like domain protein n=2 Tax=Occultella aeris TaxID=2761496 RepID=A0A7M4DJ41_9MICO|nr:Glyoxalase-like domain protein [Occultella aeris]